MKLESLEKIIFEIRKRKVQEAFQVLKETPMPKEAFCCEGELSTYLTDIACLLQTGSYKDYGQVFRLIRKALQTSTYEKIKHDEGVLETKFLHDHVLSSFTKPKFLSVYAPLHEFLASEHSSFQEALTCSRNFLLARGAHKTSKSFSYIQKHYDMLFKAFLSTPWAKPFMPYDPRLHFLNVSLKAFDEQVVAACGSCTATTIYTPTPTVGTCIAPEMRALLQAFRNRKCTTFSYVNLQNATSFNEKARVNSLMTLSDEFSEVFSCCTIAQDKGLYYAKPHTKEAILELLLDEANFCKKTKTGYYFPGDKKVWAGAIHFIVDQSMQYTDQRSALYELIHLGIIRYFHLQNCTGGQNVIMSTSCKESIDRGGKINALFLWALLDDPDIPVTAFHARALSVRSRLMQKRRFDEALSLVGAVSKQNVRLFLDRVAKYVGVTSHEARI